MLKGPLASLERHDRPACEGRSGSERSTEPGSSAKTVASQPVVGYRIRSRTAKKEILVEDAQLGKVMRDIGVLPVLSTADGRSVLALAYTQPGIGPAPAGTLGGAGLSVNGKRSRQNHFVVDGVTTNMAYNN